VSSSARTWLVLGTIVVLGTIITLGVIDRRTGTDPVAFGTLTARYDGVEQRGTLVSSEPCETDGRTEDCLAVRHPVTRRVGDTTGASDGLAVRPGERIEIDAAGPAAGLTAYVGRYLKPSDAPIGDGADDVGTFERVESGPIAEVKGRWYVEVPSAGLPAGADLLMLRFDHSRAVETPFTTADGPAGSDELSIAWFEVKVRPADGT
jgi:hypothetical protein